MPSSGSKPTVTFLFNRIADADNWSPLKNKAFKQDVVDIVKTLKKLENHTIEQARNNELLADYDMDKFPNRAAADHLYNTYGSDTLCRINVLGGGGGRKLFGLREGSVVSIIWYDNAHEIWPVGKNKR
ncbi:hypothetical protein CWC39_09695 [Corynebacterium heidelbergense]|uniref:Uncharacterized protein n=1 Tax=Corynebacterium heidelbergense TaxID=2055947 RepID=A0A364V976_9CORY|nr:hypothetical protein CWC39_09695 [Corynebacterium heidelbergense]